MELCNTRAKKSCPDMCKFYVDLAGDDMVTDTGRATTCGRKFKAPSLDTKSTKNEGQFENKGFNGKKFEDFRPKKKHFQPNPDNPTKHTTPKYSS